MATRNIVPRANGEGGIGTASKKWLNAFFSVLNVGTFTVEEGAIAPLTDNANYCGTASVRFKEMHSVKFIGTASEALYADLAEKFTTLQPADEIPVGTLLSVSESPNCDAEVCSDDCCDHVIGVISLKPAYTMNNELVGGTPICVKGRVPVRVIGPIKKSQVLVSAGKGMARCVENINEKMDKIGYALESNNEVGEKLVECFII